MPTFRPAINTDDGYFKKLVKYIPAEIIAAYTFLMGVIVSDKCIPDEPTYFPLIFFGLLIFTPVYMYLAVIDNPGVAPDLKKKMAIFHASVSVIAFLTWAFALGDEPMICYLKERIGQGYKYDSKLASIIMVGFCLAVPLLERILIGKPPPQ